MVIIIGAGPIGLATGIALKQRDIPFRIIERGALVNSLFHYPTNMTFFSTSDRLEIGGIPFISHGPKPTRSEALEYYRRAAEHYELPINLYEPVERVEGSDGDFTVITPKGEYDAKKVVVASGFYGQPNLMNVPGEELPKVKHYYDEPHPYVWQKVMVIGAGNRGRKLGRGCRPGVLSRQCRCYPGGEAHLDQGVRKILGETGYRKPHKKRRNHRLLQYRSKGNPGKRSGVANSGRRKNR